MHACQAARHRGGGRACSGERCAMLGLPRCMRRRCCRRGGLGRVVRLLLREASIVWLAACIIVESRHPI